MFMPIMFTFMFLWFPAGLVIYWLTSNLMAVGQQYVTNGMMRKAVPAKFEVTETGKRGKA
jgi:YidC/Oxa1 family membrane protein insertase